jgi:hypothetical protein
VLPEFAQVLPGEEDLSSDRSAEVQTTKAGPAKEGSET